MRCVQLLAILTITVSGIRLHKKHSLHENLEWTSEDGRSFLELATEAFHQKLDQRVRSTHEAEVTANAEIKHEAKHEALHEALHEARQMLGPLGAFRTVAEIVTQCPNYECYKRKLSNAIASAIEEDADTDEINAFNLDDPKAELDNILNSFVPGKGATKDKDGKDGEKEEEEKDKDEDGDGHDVAEAGVIQGSLPGLFYFINKVFALARNYLVAKLDLQNKLVNMYVERVKGDPYNISNYTKYPIFQALDPSSFQGDIER